jgi:uncharacterized coiled-coil DUF342 family protein
MPIVKVEGAELYRDTKNMALLSQDVNGRDEYLAKRKMLAAQKEEINKLKLEIKDIKNDVSDIKSMIHQLLNKSQNGIHP